MSAIKSSVKNPKKKVHVNLFLAPVVILVFLIAIFRASGLIPGQDLSGQEGLNLTIAAAAPGSANDPAQAGASGSVNAPGAINAPSKDARWFRSNAGGMALEETPSRVTAMSNEYALMVDSAASKDLPEILKPYYLNQYNIEVHVLYQNGEESRRQWLFSDEKKTTRLVSVLHNRSTEGIEPAESRQEGDSNSDQPTGHAPWGFIEVYNENYRITEEHMFSEDNEETIVDYSYRGGLLIKAENRRKNATAGAKESIIIYTDDYRYNRSASLRSVERLYHEDSEAVPILISFPSKVLELAKLKDFFKEKQPLSFEFLGESEIQEGFKMLYTTDEQGRILTQTLTDSEDTEIWVIQNTWSGRRLSSVLKTEGEDIRLIEFEYNDDGDLVIERNIHNGVLERVVRTGDGGRDVEELYMNGEVVLRAVWEGNRKISEERLRHGGQQE